MKIQQGKKYIWKLPVIDEMTALSYASEYNISVPIAQILLSRGFSTKELIDSYLFSSLEKDVAHPSLLKDADKAVDRIIQAIDRQEKILIFGDYDVDGITSSALMMHCLLPLTTQVNFFLPHRVRDGYGLSERVVERAAQRRKPAAAFHRLKLDNDMAVLAVSAALTDKPAFGAGGNGDGLFVSHLRFTDIRLDAELADKAADNNIEVKFAHT